MTVRRLLVVDAHPVIGAGLARFLEHEPDLEVVGQVRDAASALEEIARRRVDLAVVDIGLGQDDGLELTARIVERHAIGVVVFSGHDEEIYAERALRAGAKAYVMKVASREEILAAVRRVLDGGIHVSERMASRLLHRFGPDRNPGAGAGNIASLTDRELQVFRLLGMGLGTRGVAGRLALSVKTVETYRANIKRKLGIRSAGELVRRAVAFELSERTA